ncbi:uncharacterized protein LOC131652796 [Vicia villosa]|uniref:uncharacterized protein LOC131652796 n=1 Tax=Vicia villosa TaxID=3911 RepID=UPI00273C4FB8|nr:uncharacterized protein LOC131652796 [Vicia villosa]XP_058778736.1 uncharacterized protein LOC131652796 [Vicia villosa]XP_058778737.1 uncharacterized protein LOC131652796 [Vicia villosa]
MDLEQQLPEHPSVRKQELLNNLNFLSNLNFIFVSAFVNFLIHDNFNKFFKTNYICTYILMCLFHFLFISQMLFTIDEALSFPGTHTRIFVFMFFTCTISLLMMLIICWQLCAFVFIIWFLAVFYFAPFVRRISEVRDDVEQTQPPEHHSVRKRKFLANLLLISVQNAVTLGSFVALKIINNSFLNDNMIVIFLMFVGFNLHHTLIIIYDINTINLQNGMLEIMVIMLLNDAISFFLAYYIHYILCIAISAIIIISKIMLFPSKIKNWWQTCECFPRTWISKIKNWWRTCECFPCTWISKVKNWWRTNIVRSESLSTTRHGIRRNVRSQSVPTRIHRVIRSIIRSHST